MPTPVAAVDPWQAFFVAAEGATIAPDMSYEREEERSRQRAVELAAHQRQQEEILHVQFEMVAKPEDDMGDDYEL